MSNFEVEADLLEQDFKNMYVQWGKYSPARTGMHASAILDKEFCTREQVLKEFYPEQGERAEWNSWDWKKAAIFENGWRLHQRWQDLFFKCGHVVYSPVTSEQIAGLRHGTLIDRKPYAPELDLTHYDEERNLYFSPDAIIQFGPYRYVIEIKGIKQESYSELTSDVEQACSACETVHKAREQANLYMHLLGLTRAILLIENKNTCDFKLYVIGYERERAQQYIDRIYSVKKYIALTKVYGRAKWPERVCASFTDARAKKCPMRTVCFSVEKESEKLS